MPANLENSAVATGLEKVSFHSNPKERQCQRMLKLLQSHQPPKLISQSQKATQNKRNRIMSQMKDQDNHDGVITHLEPDILECEVKWALGSITTNKANGGDGIPAELFQILKDDTVKVLHQRKAVPMNAQTTAKLHSSHTLVK